jgi:integrase
MTNSTKKDKAVGDYLQNIVREVAGKGWLVSKSGTKIRLRVRVKELVGDGCWSRSFLQWDIGAADELKSFISDLKRQAETGMSLDAAWEQLEGQEGIGGETGPVKAQAKTNWKLLIQDYLRWREEFGNRVSQKTLVLETRYLNAALKTLSDRRPPTKAYDLVAEVASLWSGKPRAKKQAVEAVIRFLNYGFDQAGLDGVWVLPTHQKKHFLEKSKKVVKATLVDSEILELIDSIPSAEWRSVICFLAAYGLRPEELFHLSVRVNPFGEKQFWCNYEKASGNFKTSPRWLHQIPLIDAQGRQVDWDLVGAWELNLIQFPPMADRGGALVQYLKRSKLWQSLKAKKAENDEVLRPYTFRNSYSVRGHSPAYEYNSTAMSDAMGHSEATHSLHYETSTVRNTAATFARGMKVQPSDSQ